MQRVVGGRDLGGRYIDRSIHSLSGQRVDEGMLKAKVDRPEAEAIKGKLEQLIQRRQQRVNSPWDHTPY